MNIYESLLAKAINGGGGGGGGGDFSTAEITIVNNMPDDIPIYIYGSCIVNDTLNFYTEFEVGTSSALIMLYKGSSRIAPDTEDEIVTVSGSATIDELGGITITGDCTITISEATT